MDETTPAQPSEYGKGYGKRPLWQWVLIYLVVGGVIYAAIYYFYIARKGGYSNTYAPAPAPAESSPATGETQLPETQTFIRLTASGFEPATLPVRSGTTVVWTNESGGTGNVSSDSHPTHTLYPPLNLGNIPDGSSVSLRFDTAGTYTYHNHLIPSETGTIIVQ